ncbi:MAG: hypothetical protein ACI3YH_05720 [Eubacteriales bacterium]
MKQDNASTPEMPVGFALTLALHPSALQRYAELDKKAQTEFLCRAESATTRAEMQALVKELEPQER